MFGCALQRPFGGFSAKKVKFLRVVSVGFELARQVLILWNILWNF